jgi:hypothetical protein
VSEGGDGNHASLPIFREVNLRIAELSRPGESLEFVCECGSLDCTERIPLAIEVFEQHATSTQRIVAPGHERSTDALVARGETFVVVADRE